MHKVTDERLKTKRLKNLAFDFYFQSFLIIMIIVIQTLRDGFETLTENPLMFIWLSVVIIMSFQEMTLTRDVTDSRRQSLRSVAIGLLVFILVACGVFLLIGTQNFAPLFFSIVIGTALLAGLLAWLIIRRRN